MTCTAEMCLPRTSLCRQRFSSAPLSETLNDVVQKCSGGLSNFIALIREGNVADNTTRMAQAIQGTEQCLQKVVEVAESKNIFRTCLLSLASTILPGFGVVESGLDYFRSYKTFSKIYQEKGRAHAYIWAIGNASLAVTKAILSLSGISRGMRAVQQYVLVRSGHNLTRNTAEVLTKAESRGQAIRTILCGVSAAVITETLLGQVLPQEFIKSGLQPLLKSDFLTNIGASATQWGCRWAAFKGESIMYASLARSKGLDNETVARLQESFFNSAMLYVSARFLFTRLGDELHRAASTLFVTPVAEAAPLVQEGVTQITGEIPQLGHDNFEVNLETCSSLKDELQSIVRDIQDFESEHPDLALRELGALKGTITNALSDNLLTAEELNTILAAHEAVSGLEVSLPASVPAPETPSGGEHTPALEIFQGKVRGWLIGRVDPSQPPSMENLTINGKPWHLSGNLASRWNEEGIFLPEDQRGKTIFEKMQNLLTRGVNGWARNYEEVFADRKDITQLLGRTADGDVSTDSPWHVLISALAKKFDDSPTPPDIDGLDWKELLNKFDEHDSIASLFHIDNGTGSVLHSFVQAFSHDLIAQAQEGGIKVDQEEAEHIARRILAKLSYEIVLQKGDEIIRQGVESISAHTGGETPIELPKLDIAGRLLGALKLEAQEGQPLDTPALRSVLSALQHLQTLGTPQGWEPSWPVNTIKQVWNNAPEWQGSLEERLQHYLRNAAIIFELAKQAPDVLKRENIFNLDYWINNPRGEAFRLPEGILQAYVTLKDQNQFTITLQSVRQQSEIPEVPDWAIGSLVGLVVLSLVTTSAIVWRSWRR